MSKHNDSFWFSFKGLMALGLIAATTYFLLVEHRQHFFEYLPLLIILLCPLMHVFMHRGHGSHGEEKHNIKGSTRGDTPESFQEKSEKSNAYREGFIEGLQAGRDETKPKESDDGK